MEHKSRLIFNATRWQLIPLVQIACIFDKEWIFFFKLITKNIHLILFLRLNYKQ